MTTNQTVNVGIGIQATDDSGVELIQQLSDNVSLAEKAVREAKKTGGLPAIVAAAEVQRVQQFRQRTDELTISLKAVDTALKNIDPSDASFPALEAQARALRAEIDQLNTSAQRVPAQIGTSRSGVSGASLSKVTGAASSLGLDPGGGLTAASGLLDVTDALKQLSGELVKAPGLIGKVATAGASMLLPLGGVAAGLGAVLAVALPLAIAAGVVAFALHKFNEALAAGERAVNAALAAQDNYYQALATMTTEQVQAEVARLEHWQNILRQQRDETRRALSVGDTRDGDVAKQLAELNKQIGENEHTLVRYTQGLQQNTFATNDAAAASERAAAIRRAQVQQQMQFDVEMIRLIRDGSREALDARRQGMQDELEAIRANLPQLRQMAREDPASGALLDTANQRVTTLTTQLGQLAREAEPAIAARERESAVVSASLSAIEARFEAEKRLGGLMNEVTAVQLEARQQALKTERDLIAALLPEVQALAATSEEGQAQLKKYQDRLNDINTDLQLLAASLPEVRAENYARGLREIELAEYETGQAIVGIRKDGLARVAAIERDAATAQVQAAKKRDDDLVKLSQDTAARIAETNQRYMQTEREAFDRYRLEESRATAQHNKARLRLLEDLQMSMLDAEENNDVVAFIRIKRAGQLQLKRLNEDAGDSERIRHENFIREREQADTQHQQTLAQMNAQADERAASIRDAFAEELVQIEARKQTELDKNQEAIDQRIAAEETGLLQRINAIAQNYGLERKLIDEIAARRMEDYSEQDAIITEAMAAQLARFEDDLKAKERAEENYTRRLADRKRNIEQAAGEAAANRIAAAFSGATTTITTSINGMIQAIAATAAAARASASSPYNPARTASASGLQAVAFANEGVVTQPTLALIGERLGAGEAEAVIKFKMSEGLGSLRGGDTYQMQIGAIHVGGGVSAAEVSDALNRGFMALIQGITAARASSGGRSMGMRTT